MYMEISLIVMRIEETRPLWRPCEGTYHMHSKREHLSLNQQQSSLLKKPTASTARSLRYHPFVVRLFRLFLSEMLAMMIWRCLVRGKLFSFPSSHDTNDCPREIITKFAGATMSSPTSVVVSFRHGSSCSSVLFYSKSSSISRDNM